MKKCYRRRGHCVYVLHRKDVLPYGIDRNVLRLGIFSHPAQRDLNRNYRKENWLPHRKQTPPDPVRRFPMERLPSCPPFSKNLFLAFDTCFVLLLIVIVFSRKGFQEDEEKKPSGSEEQEFPFTKNNKFPFHPGHEVHIFRYRKPLLSGMMRGRRVSKKRGKASKQKDGKNVSRCCLFSCMCVSAHRCFFFFFWYFYY